MALTDKVVTKAGFSLIVRSGSVSKLMQQAIMDGLRDISKNYAEKVKKNVSLDDHSLAELRRMEHPYAVGKPENIPHDDRMVHIQTGELKRGIKYNPPESTTSRTFSVYVYSESPHTPYLIFGTSRMRPRRFHEKAFNEIKDKYWDPVLERLRKLNYRVDVGATSARLIER
jgi:hypothetical protein